MCIVVLCSLCRVLFVSRHTSVPLSPIRHNWPIVDSLNEININIKSLHRLNFWTQHWMNCHLDEERNSSVIFWQAVSYKKFFFFTILERFPCLQTFFSAISAFWRERLKLSFLVWIKLYSKRCVYSFLFLTSFWQCLASLNE